MSTAEIVKILSILSIPKKLKDFNNGKNKWKRFKKFKMANGHACRYFYLSGTPLIAVACEDESESGYNICIRLPVAGEQEAFEEVHDYKSLYELQDEAYELSQSKAIALDEYIEEGIEYSGKFLTPNLFCIDVAKKNSDFELGSICIAPKITAPNMGDQSMSNLPNNFWPKDLEVYELYEGIYQPTDRSLKRDEVLKKLQNHGFLKMKCQTA